ncbi:hypothetical protein E4U57_002277 [Claviceps arundinis]|uniref:Tat pathway signal sequence protein n=1 Tax=Claviceps arundinis TaxID=1623583 RepID=A0A9P7MQY1_9HYPO|nr:hypothetical protein E4U57_002277 [Claviceps arundinis]KAG5963860.1 hypothetical protein E4U56_002562 [Claviceps arundinis]
MDKLPTFEKTKSVDYMPIDASSEGENEDDSLINPRWTPVTSRVSRVYSNAARIAGIFLYSIFLVTITSWWWKRERLHGPGVISSPLTPYVHYEEKAFPKMDTHKYSIMGPPSPEVDAKWDELTQFFFTEFPYEDMKKLGRENEAIQLPNGNFMVLYTVNHLLHCLKRLHHSRHPDYYFPNITEAEKIKGNKHDMHCLEDLVQEVICHADTAPYTTRWYQKDPRPTGNSDILHECVNWDMLKEELKRKHVNPWEPGLLVHPVFGPVVPDGKNTVFPERMGFPNDFLHVGETEEEYEERIHRLGISSGRDPE